MGIGILIFFVGLFYIYKKFCFTSCNILWNFQITLNPLAEVCNSGSKAAWELQIDFLKPPRIHVHFLRDFRKAACSYHAAS
jgi:hypothetical protein